MIAQPFEKTDLNDEIVLVERNTQKFLGYLYTNLKNAHPEMVKEFDEQVLLQMQSLARISKTSLRILLEPLCGFESGYLGFCLPQIEYIANYLGSNRKKFSEVSPYSYVLMCLAYGLGVDVGAKEVTKPQKIEHLDIPFEIET